MSWGAGGKGRGGGVYLMFMVSGACRGMWWEWMSGEKRWIFAGGLDCERFEDERFVGLVFESARGCRGVLKWE